MTHDPTLDAWMNEDTLCPRAGEESYDITLSELRDLVARVREDERDEPCVCGSEWPLSRLTLTYHDGYAAALRDAVDAIKARCSSDGEFMCVECEVSVAAIEALGGEQ